MWRNLLFSLFAVSIAGIAAIAATTALINSPLRIGPAAGTETPTAQTPAPAPPAGKPADPAAGGKPAAPGSAAPDATKGASNAKKDSDTKDDEESDKDPYEGIAPEDLPPDMQYNADSSVSFPTNI